MTRMRKPRPLIATRQQNSIPAGKQGPQPDTANRQAQADPEQTIAQIQSVFGNSADLQIHRFQAFPATIACALLYLRSIINMEELNQTVLYPLLQQVAAPGDMADLARSLPHASTKEGTTIQDAAQAIISGEVVLLVSGLASALFIPLKKYEQRSVTEPENEKVVRGPRDGFIESLWANVGILRQRIKDPRLRLEVFTLGTRTSVEVCLIHLEGIANPQIVEEVRTRLQRINVDSLLSVSSIAEFIADSPWSPLPTYQASERPDRLTSALLDGRIGILLDGTPLALIVPAVFWDFLKSPDDYIENPYFSSFIRIIRLTSHLITLLVPGAYVALTTFHLEVLPQSLAVIIAGARTRTPFPTAVEMFLMELTIELLREAGLRMPGVFGQTMSIVGALVIGEAAVTAGLIEPIIVVLVALTTLASFVVPSYPAAISIRLLRFPLILFSATMGFFGLFLGAMFYLIYLVSLRSFGIPYFAPLAPLFLKDMGDMLIRLPWWQQFRRPTYYRPQDDSRAGPNQKPGPDKEP